MTTFIANESKIKPKGHLNCSITQPAKTDFPPPSLPLGDNICGIYFSLEEAFEFCWSLFADENNTYQKSTRKKFQARQ